ncbi:hypothetical protein LCGC14_0351370 [marine sediment metagenome]|uniref:Uncharacterized protein n=1 Tax=marine sediment metagenome TaxID=412755 RepID=A0A0F9WIN9_9ZZZZ
MSNGIGFSGGNFGNMQAPSQTSLFGPRAFTPFESPKKIGQLFGKVGGAAGVLTALGSLLGFARQGFPEFNLPEQQFGAGEARQIASRFGTQLKQAGASSLERTGLETPSRFLGVQARAGTEQAGLLANLLRQVDQMSLQRSMAEFQAKALKQQNKTNVLSGIADISGLVGAGLLL